MEWASTLEVYHSVLKQKYGKEIYQHITQKHVPPKNCKSYIHHISLITLKQKTKVKVILKEIETKNVVDPTSFQRLCL